MNLDEKAAIFKEYEKMYEETVSIVNQMSDISQRYNKPFNEQEAREHLEFLKRNIEAMRNEIERLKKHAEE